MTVDEIIESTIEMLTSPAEHAAVTRMDQYMALIACARPVIERARSRFHLRCNTTATINSSQLRATSFSICVGGVACGTIRIGSSGSAEFKIKGVNKAFASLGSELQARWIPWADERVRRYLDSCETVAEQRFQRREQAIQAAFLDAMLGRTVRRKDQLRDFQPVALGGVPIQLPVPVRPRGKHESKTPGHLDVLARHSQGRLAVFELKQPQRAASRGALRQAVAYAASLEWLMRRDAMRPLYWSAFGSRRTTQMPQFHACAVVPMEARNDLLSEWDELETGNRAGIRLGVYVYSHRDRRLTIWSVARV